MIVPWHYISLISIKVIQKGSVVKGIYVLNLPLRRGDFDTILLQKEKMWIYNLG